MTEADLVSAIIEAARLLGWLVHHDRPGRTAHGWRTAVSGDVGFPDLVLVRGNRLVVAECKSAVGRPTLRQQDWLAAFAAVGAETYLWRPADWPDAVLAVLGS